jgi:hypothetical protein
MSEFTDTGSERGSDDDGDHGDDVGENEVEGVGEFAVLVGTLCDVIEAAPFLK